MYHLTNPLHFFIIASSFRRRELGLVFRPIMRSSYNMIVGVDFIRLGLRRILDSIFGDFWERTFILKQSKKARGGPRRTIKDQHGSIRTTPRHHIGSLLTPVKVRSFKGFPNLT
jgi:hypothetical protein